MGIKTYRKNAANFQATHWLELVSLCVVLQWIKMKFDEEDDIDNISEILEDHLLSKNPPVKMDNNLKFTCYIVHKIFDN